MQQSRSKFVIATGSAPEGSPTLRVDGDPTTDSAISHQLTQDNMISNSPRLLAGQANHQADQPDALPLIQRFCSALDQEEIRYCHWKSNAALDRSANGLNDLDLLISRADAQRFSELVAHLGFKAARHHGEAQLPGVVSYYGFEPTAQRLVHIHAHYQLVLGHDRTKNYHIAIEEAYLGSRTQVGLFYAPTAEFEFVIFVLRMMLKFGTWDALLSRQSRLPKAARGELAYLLARIDWAEVHRIVQHHLPTVASARFDECAQAIQGKLTLARALNTGAQLTRALEPYTRYTASHDLWLKGWRRVANAWQRRRFGQTAKAYMSSGGVMIALVGGDGAGKSTAIAALRQWLAKDFAIQRVHFGKPPQSLATRVVRTAVRLTRFAQKRFAKGATTNAAASPADHHLSGRDNQHAARDYGKILLHFCTARDRYQAYVRARRFVNNGGIVIADRFPLPEIQSMESPQLAQLLGERAAQPLLRWLLDKEKAYYARYQPPEILAILRLDPALAVARKPEEPDDLVARRSREVWEADWSKRAAHVIDAARPQAEVLATLKELVWLHL